jgi:CPA1 family monovalent cation:H+ antiporter
MMLGTMTTNGIALQLILLGLLAFVAVFAGLAKQLAIPYPIVLVLAGLLVSVIPGIPRIGLSPNLVFLVFLPPLLYSAAWTLSWQEFRKNIVSIGWLAFGLVVFTVAAVSVTAGSFLPGFDWKAGFVLGAVVAATDAIAATATARRMGLSQSIAQLLEAESLLNDGTGLLALQFGLVILVQGRMPGFVDGFGRLLYLVGAGLGIGILIGHVVSWFERWVDDGPVEIVISLLVPYLTYLAGNAMHASGVLAVIACGMVMSRESSSYLSGAVRLELDAVWNALTFVLNGLVFVLIGLQLPFVLAEIHGMPLWTLAAYGAAFSAFLIVLRLVWVFAIRYARYWVGVWQSDPIAGPARPARLPKKSLFLVGWTGLRGVLSLTAAISLPEVLPNGKVFPQRNMIVFLTFCVILTTLVLQGLTLPALIRKLGLREKDDAVEREEEARRAMLVAALDAVKRRKWNAQSEIAVIYDELERVYESRLAAMPQPRKGLENRAAQVNHARWREAILVALGVERATLAQLQQDGRVSDETAKVLQRELDLAESRVHTSGSLL